MIDASTLLHLLTRVREAIEDTPGLGELTSQVVATIRDLTPGGDLGTLTVAPCGDPTCICSPDCTVEPL